MVSPTSSTAAISAAIVSTMAAGDPARFVALSATLALVIGATFALLGLFRLGFVSQFLAFSVQTGFMFGLGLTIAVGQLPKVLGISAPTDESFLPGLAHLLSHLGETNGWTALLGLGGLGAMVLLNRYAPRLPAALAVVAAGTALTALLGYAESASVAQDLATRHGYDVDPDRELLAIGAANGLAGLLGGFMVAGGASQSAANDRAGARTQAAGLLVAVLALVTALFLTPLFFYLPEAVLGAIVLFAIMGFFRTGELRRIARLSRLSFIGALVALIGVLVLGVLPGLMLAVGLSIVMLLTRAARPGLSLLGRDPAVGRAAGRCAPRRLRRPDPERGPPPRPRPADRPPQRPPVLRQRARRAPAGARPGPPRWRARRRRRAAPGRAGRVAGPGPAAGHPDEPEHRHRDGGHPRPAAHHPGRRRAHPVARRRPTTPGAPSCCGPATPPRSPRGASSRTWPAPSTLSSTGRRKRRRRRAGLSSS